MSPSSLDRAGRWLLESGIREASGGVARYYLADERRNRTISNEITGYAASALVYLYRFMGDARYLEAASDCARFLITCAWDRRLRIFPFEHGASAAPRAFFFDSGIIVRGLLSVWRETRDAALLDVAAECGLGMRRDFGVIDPHPILELPGKTPRAQGNRWSQAPGCYQLKSAMAWAELAEATGDAEFMHAYHAFAEHALAGYRNFLPGDRDPHEVMNRLHAFLYFVEGLLPCSRDKRFSAAICEGICKVSSCVTQIEGFVRSDVLAQLLRIRVFADWAGAAPIDAAVADSEARRLEDFQIASGDQRLDGGVWFGERAGAPIPHASPVSTGFGLQALDLWRQRQAGGEPVDWRLLV